MTLLEKSRWLKNRLKSMEAGEIISRIADGGRHVALRAALPALQQRSHRRLKKPDYSCNAPGIQCQLGTISKPVQQAVISVANNWLAHRASIFSLNEIPLGKPIDWHRDYSSGVVVPCRYSALINARDQRTVGDIKYIWELNRLQHLILLALAWSWTRNADYWNEIEKQLLSWQRSNPFMMGVNWKSPLEAGMRLISWAYVSFLIARSMQASETYRKILQQNIYQHQYFIRKFYSTHSSANNHLIGEMAGLYVASVVWPWFRESASWRAFARRKLVEEMFRQVEADGVGKERATEYQIFILEFFVLAGALGHLTDDPFPNDYWARLKRMTGFLSAMANRSGDLPIFGDGDSGQAVRLPETTTRERSDSLVRMGERQEEASTDLRSVLLLWGQTPDEIPIGPLPTSGRSVDAFPYGGYYVLATDRGGDNEMVVVLDSGPLGLAPLNAHGHADALSFWFSYGGREFLIDPGTYCYQANQWRSYFRGTAAHNTVRVDSEDQSVSGGPFLWRQTAHCRTEQVDDTNEFAEVAASHDGYRRLKDPVIHTRSLRLLKKSRRLVITDRLECQGSHAIELLFHFSEKCHVRQAGADSFEALNCNKRVVVGVDSRLKPELYRGCENPIFGWVSRTFGVKEPSFTLVSRTDITGPVQFVTEISAL